MAPVAMFNALWFRPDGGAARYGEYGRGVVPILDRIGAEVLVPFLPVATALEHGFDPDIVGFVRYPSREVFDEMWNGDEYAAVSPLRRDATDRAVLTACTIEPEDAEPAVPPTGIVVLNMLWFHPGGRVRYDEYLAAAEPLVQGIGGRFLSPRFVPTEAVEDDVVPDLLFLGSYPSEQALFDMVTSAAYAEAAEIRSAAVARSMTTTLRVD